MKPTTKTSKKKTSQQKRTPKTRPGVFIIESLDFEDEQENRFEGRILRDMLQLSGNEVEYWYVRTWKELTEEIFQRFWDSGMRYLHLSSHGNPQEVCLTIDRVPFAEFGGEIREYLTNRRLFVSACEVVNKEFAKACNPDEECYSIIGPRNSIRFSDAAVMWASFYHLMLRDADSMKAEKIRLTLDQLEKLFGEKFLYF